MKEESVFWVGTQPLLDDRSPGLAHDEQFVAAMTRACAAAGCKVHRFVAALGPYGTWLVEIERDGEDQRVLWNGKEQRLVLQVKLEQGGWEDPRSLEIPDQDTEGFVAGITELLADP